ncbi:MFS transporter asaE [Metarhizium anisopliae]|nr:MFS transporter asaE [Metarhizium anisopliae]
MMQFRREEVKEGGWLAVLGAWCANFCTFGLINCVGVFQEYYISGPLSHYSSSAVSWITSTQVGHLFDNYGPDWLLRGGSFLYVGGLVLVSFADKYYQLFLVQGLLVSVGSSAVFHSSTAAVLRAFSARPRRQALAVGVMTSGASICGIVLPIMMRDLIGRVGFPWMMRITAFSFIGLLSITCLLVQSSLPLKPNPFKIRDYLKQLQDLPLALTSTAFFLFMMGMLLPFNYMLLQAKSAGASPVLITYLLPILNGASVLGRLVGGSLAEPVGHYRLIKAMAILCAVSCLTIWLPTTKIAGIVLFPVFFGFSSGGFIALCPSLIAKISNKEVVGTRTGASFSMQALGALVGSPLGGALVAWQDGAYSGLKIFCGCSMLGSACFFMAASRAWGKQQAVTNNSSTAQSYGNISGTYAEDKQAG